MAGVGITDGSAIALASIVRSSLTLRVLDLRENDGIGTAGVLALTDAVDANASCALSDLHYCPPAGSLTRDPDLAAHGQALAAAVAAAKRKRLAAQAAAAGKREFLGCPLLFVRMQRSKLEELTGVRFIAATLTSSIAQLAEALGQMKKLQKLQLQVHQIEQREMDQIARAIIDSGAPLRVVDLHKCRIMGSGFDAVCELVKLPSVVTLRLADTTVCATGSAQLALTIARHPSLELLDCTDNTTLGSEGAASLAAALQTCEQITSVSLENCGVGDAGSGGAGPAGQDQFVAHVAASRAQRDRRARSARADERARLQRGVRALGARLREQVEPLPQAGGRGTQGGRQSVQEAQRRAGEVRDHVRLPHLLCAPPPHIAM